MPSSRILTFADPYEYQKSVRAGELKIFVTARGEFEAKLMQIDLHRLWMQRSWLSLPHVTHTAMNKGRSALFFLADIHQERGFHSGFEISPETIVVHSLGAEHYRRAPANRRWAAMSLPPEDLAAFGRALVGRELAAPAVSQLIRPGPGLLSRLMNLHRAAGDLAATAPDVLAHPEVARAIEQELARAMIACLTDSAAPKSNRHLRQRLAVMRRFEHMLEARENQPIYITEVCAEIGVAARSLRSYCQEHLRMSPHRYLWLRRMNLVRQALARADRKTKTVTQIANDYGFAELGRFAVAYREVFGESPSATLRREP